MGKKHDELMQEITLLRQEIFDLRCEIDQLRNMIPPVMIALLLQEIFDLRREIDQLRNMIPPVIPIYSAQYCTPATPQCPVWSDSITAKDKV